MQRIATFFLFALALLAGCQNTGGGSGVIASVSVHDIDPGARPTALVRWDGNTLVAWGAAAVMYEAFVAVNGIPIYGPFFNQAGEILVYQREPIETSWHADINAPIPEAARVLFRQGEISAWGLVFDGGALEE